VVADRLVGPEELEIVVPEAADAERCMNLSGEHLDKCTDTDDRRMNRRKVSG
jgi:hypothetical protein